MQKFSQALKAIRSLALPSLSKRAKQDLMFWVCVLTVVWVFMIAWNLPPY